MSAVLNTFTSYERTAGRLVESIDRARGGQLGGTAPVGASLAERPVHTLTFADATLEEWRALHDVVNSDVRRGALLEWQPPDYSEPVLCRCVNWSASGPGTGRITIAISLEEV